MWSIDLLFSDFNCIILLNLSAAFKCHSTCFLYWNISSFINSHSVGQGDLQEYYCNFKLLLCFIWTSRSYFKCNSNCLAFGDHNFIIFVAEKLTSCKLMSYSCVTCVTSEWRRMLLDFWKAVRIGVFVISWAGHLSFILTRKMQCATNVDSCIIFQIK